MSKKMDRGADFTVYIDGASSGNPGDAGVGVVIESKDKKQKETISRYIGTGTNNVAEYTALIIALRRLETLQAREVDIRSDSELLVKQLRGEYSVKKEHLKKLFSTAVALCKKIPSLHVGHIRRDSNNEADALAKEAIKKYRRANRMVAAEQIPPVRDSD